MSNSRSNTIEGMPTLSQELDMIRNSQTPYEYGQKEGKKNYFQTIRKKLKKKYEDEDSE